MISLKHVSKSFGEKKVLSDFSLFVEDGKRAIIMGTSGIGKTTLFNIMLGLEKADEGVIKIDKKISALFQEDRLIENLSLMNNLLLVTDDKERALALLKEADLEGEEKSKVENLSGGMKRRVSLIRALLTDFDVLLLDEPFSGLDDFSKEKIASLIKKETKGKTLLVITHDRSDSALLDADQTIILRHLEL